MQNLLYQKYKPFIELKHLKRSGWLSWVDESVRTESVAAHTSGCCLLAFAMLANRKELGLNLFKAIRMLNLHEVGELAVGDITPFGSDKERQYKKQEPKKALVLLGKIKNSGTLKALYNEYCKNTTPLAKFCNDVDKIECVWQSKAYTKRNIAISYNDFFKNFGYTIEGLVPDQYQDCFDAHYNYWKKRISNPLLVDLSKEEKNFYKLVNKLKELPRTGWKMKNVANYEMVADHVYGTIMLAEIVNCELGLKLNMEKVCTILAMHELAETIVGDITPLDKQYSGKYYIEAKIYTAISKWFNSGDFVEAIWKEFEARSTPEGDFARTIDKLETVFMAKYYTENKLGDDDTLREFLSSYIRCVPEKDWTLVRDL